MDEHTSRELAQYQSLIQGKVGILKEGLSWVLLGINPLYRVRQVLIIVLFGATFSINPLYRVRQVRNLGYYRDFAMYQFLIQGKVGVAKANSYATKSSSNLLYGYGSFRCHRSWSCHIVSISNVGMVDFRKYLQSRGGPVSISYMGMVAYSAKVTKQATCEHQFLIQGTVEL